MGNWSFKFIWNKNFHIGNLSYVSYSRFKDKIFMKFLICQNVPKGNIKIDHLVYKKCIDNQVNAQYHAHR